PACGALPASSSLPTRRSSDLVALTFADGVVIAGDRRATSGDVIAQRDIEKVFVTDSYSAVGIAGSAGIALQLVRLYTVDLENYEDRKSTRLNSSHVKISYAVF